MFVFLPFNTIVRFLLIGAFVLLSFLLLIYLEKKYFDK